LVTSTTVPACADDTKVGTRAAARRMAATPEFEGMGREPIERKPERQSSMGHVSFSFVVIREIIQRNVRAISIIHTKETSWSGVCFPSRGASWQFAYDE
jgi:hypothetical protein